MEVDDEETVAVGQIVGRTIVSGEFGEGGLHLWLDNGRAIVLIGDVVAIVDLKRVLN